MKINSRSFFQFISNLCDEIEAYTTREEVLNKNAFTYKKSNLKAAVQRNLYIALVNNRDLLDAYCETKAIQSKKINFKKNVELEIASKLMRPAVLQNVRVLNKWMYLSYFKLILNSLRIKLLELKNFRSKEVNIVLFYVTHEKFIRFFKPIIDQLKLPYVFLLAPYTGIRDANLDKRFVIRSGYFGNGFHLPVGGTALSQWPYLTGYYDTISKILTNLKVTCAIVPEGDAPEHEILNAVCKALKIPSICIQQGWAPFVHTGFRNMSYQKMLIWGEGFKKLLQPYNSHLVAKVVGNHLINIPNPKFEKKVKAIGFFLQSPEEFISHEIWEFFIRAILKTARENPQIKIYVREHPAYALRTNDLQKLGGIKNLIYVRPQEEPLQETMAHIQLSVAIYSSTILDSLLAGVFPVIFNLTSLPEYLPPIHRFGASYQVKSMQEYYYKMGTLLRNGIPRSFEKNRRNFMHEYFYSEKNHTAAELISREIKTSIHTKVRPS